MEIADSLESVGLETFHAGMVRLRTDLGDAIWDALAECRHHLRREDSMTDAAAPRDSRSPAQSEPPRSHRTFGGLLLMLAVLAGALMLMLYVAYDFSPDLRAGVVRVVGRTGSAGMRWVVLGLWDRDQLVRTVAEEALKHKRTSAVAELRGLLQSADPHIRDGAANALRVLEKTARDALPDLIVAAEDDADPAVRSQAVSSLLIIGGDDANVRTALRKLAADTSLGPNARLNAMQHLADSLPENRSIVPVLIQALEDDNLGIRASAADFLGNATLDKETVIPALKRACAPAIPACAKKSKKPWKSWAKATLNALLSDFSKVASIFHCQARYAEDWSGYDPSKYRVLRSLARGVDLLFARFLLRQERLSLLSNRSSFVARQGNSVRNSSTGLRRPGGTSAG